VTPPRKAPASAYRGATWIEVGCAGGITGGFWSLGVGRDGSIRYREHRMRDFRSRRATRVPRRTVSDWFARLERMKVLDIDTSGYGRVMAFPDAKSCSIGLVGPVHSNAVDVGPGSGAPATVRDLYREIVARIWGEDDRGTPATRR
jgi:hypothetical protein